RVSFVVVVAGLMWFLTGRRSIQAIVAPLIFLLLAVPLPALLVNTATLPLQLMASRMAESLLSLIAIPVFRDGNLLVLPSGTLEVAEACSGLRSLVSLAALGGVLAWAADGSMVRRGALVLLAIPIAIVMNGLRIAVTGAVVERWAIPLATGNWHLLTGWITFIVSLGV